MQGPAGTKRDLPRLDAVEAGSSGSAALGEAAPPASEGAPAGALPLWVRSLEQVSRILGGGAAVVCFAMMLNVVADAMARSFFNRPIPGTLELTTYWWMPLVAFFPLAFAQLRNDHLRVTLLLDGLSPRARRLADSLVLLLALALLGLLSYLLVGGAVKSTEIGESAHGLVSFPIWPIKWLAVLGMLGFMSQVAVSIYRSLSARPSGQAEAAAEHEGPRVFAQRGAAVGVSIAAIASAVLVALLLFAGLPREVVGILIVVLTVSLLLAGVPIAFSMLIAALLGLMKLGGIRVIEGLAGEQIFNSSASWQLSVIPLFVLMGIAMWRSGVTGKVYTMASQWLGRLPGGLAIGTNFAGAGLAAASGSSVGISYALGRMAIPEMMRANYSPALATGVVTMAGTLGQLIPPSVMLVIYAGVAQVPTGPQLIAAIVPGLLIALGFGVLIAIRAALNPRLAPRADMTGVTWASRWRSLLGSAPVALVVVIVIGGLMSGIVTPTEAGALGALAALVVGVVVIARSRGEAGRSGAGAVFRFVKDSLMDTVASTASIFFLIVSVKMLTLALSLSNVTQTLATWVVDANLSRTAFLLVLIVVYLVLGMFLDSLAMILLTLPVLAGPLAALGVDMIWFGIFVVILAEIAIVSPPIGMLTFIVHRLAQDPEVNGGRQISLTTVFRGVLPFIAVALLLLVVLIFVPELALWLPGLSGG